MVAEWWLGQPAAEQDDPVCPKLRASWLFRDLVALDGEFAQLTIDLGKRNIAVETESIELEGVYLGRFRIRLQWQQDREQRPGYRILPLDDCSSRSMPEVCHPHVSNNVLCEGDASWPIRQALVDARLHDFFLVVSRVLESYNLQSAYLRLAEWESDSCEGCGDLIDDSDSCSCEHCGDGLCSGCMGSCSGCDASFCSGCLETCGGCDCAYCPSCLAECGRCGGEFCNDCLSEEICDDCQTNGVAEADAAKAQNENAKTQETHAEV
jgi:hypothetical protein